MDRKFHYIYKITRFDGKYYIGMHSTDDLDDGYFGSGRRLQHSLMKHGREHHTKIIVEFLPTREALKCRERDLVNEQTLKDPCCMNLQLGGEGGLSAMTQEQISRWHAAGARAVGKKYGRANGLRNGPLNLKSDTAWGDSARRKRLKTFHEIAHQSGNSNSQFGTKWVSKDGVAIKIPKHDLAKYLEQGYNEGRKTIPQ